jgi:small-conductance mechanosensitive channel
MIPRGFCLVLILLTSAFSLLCYGQDYPAPSIAVGDAQPTDQAIEERLLDIFQEIEGLEEVHVQAEAGVVTLTGNVPTSSLLTEAESLSRAVSGIVTVQNDIQRDGRVFYQLQPVLRKLESILENLLINLPMLLLALMVILGSWYCGGWVSKVIALPVRWVPNLFVDELVRLLIRLFFLLIGVLLGAELVGATALLVSILGGLGVLGLAFGFAIRDTIENFVASILLSLRQPFGMNEHVVVDGSEGLVLKLTSRATILLDFNGNHVRIPNSTVYKSTIINYSRNPKRRFQFDVGVDTDISPSTAQALAVKALLALDGILDDPKPQCVIHALGDSNVVLRIYGWVHQGSSDFSKVRSAAMADVKRTFEEADVTMPEPIYRLRVENMGEPASLISTSNKTIPVEKESRVEKAAPDTTPDTAILQQIEQYKDSGDLLNDSAPKE